MLDDAVATDARLFEEGQLLSAGADRPRGFH
jgi:hypothetical protein